MPTFYMKTRRWPTGEIIGATESTTFAGPPGAEDKVAPAFLATGPTEVLQFLFWHTGRRLTGHRHVHWLFNTMGWSVWEATKWYGTPPTGPGGGIPRVHAEPFSLISNSVMTGAGTPIDGPGSTFSPASAYPFNGNDKEIGTAGGAATVAARDPLATLSFCGWQKLVYGGTPGDDTFIETDDGVSASNVPSAGTGVFEFTPGSTITIPAGQSAEILASYGNNGSSGGFTIVDILKGLDRIPSRPRRPWDIIADPPPWDILRRRIVEDLLRTTEPLTSNPAVGTDFNSVINAVPNMSADDLKRTLSSVKTQAELGQTAVSAIEAQIKRLGKTK